MEKVLNRGYEIFMRKMAMPQYEDYRQDQELANKLLENCIQEALMTAVINEKAKTILKKREKAKEQQNER